jgi:Holliday junction resolvasome RuvABC DNA-binding subunit
MQGGLFPVAKSENQQIAAIFAETADLLEIQSGDGFRVAAYRRAARLLDKLQLSARELWERGGRDGLETLPGIGPSLAASIEEFLGTGHCRTLDRLKGHTNPEDLFAKLPGIGETLAHRIHEELHIETLEEVEAAAYDGRLASVRGIGEHRAEMLKTYLAGRLANSTRRAAGARPLSARHDGHTRPPLGLLLWVDREYRSRAEEGRLHRIAPHRFNPTNQTWLPVWHYHRKGWHFTALFSNTARAHQLGKTRDWVVLVAEKEGHEEQFTVVTEYRGELHGLRVVRGLEEECHEFYARPLPDDVQAVHNLAEHNA